MPPPTESPFPPLIARNSSRSTVSARTHAYVITHRGAATLAAAAEPINSQVAPPFAPTRGGAVTLPAYTAGLGRLIIVMASVRCPARTVGPVSLSPPQVDAFIGWTAEFTPNFVRPNSATRMRRNTDSGESPTSAVGHECVGEEELREKREARRERWTTKKSGRDEIE